MDYVVDLAAKALILVGALNNLCREQSEKMGDVTHQFALHKLDYKALQEKVTCMENDSRRSNFLFCGIREERGETDSDCLNKVYDLLIRKVVIPHRC